HYRHRFGLKLALEECTRLRECDVRWRTWTNDDDAMTDEFVRGFQRLLLACRNTLVRVNVFKTGLLERNPIVAFCIAACPLVENATVWSTNSSGTNTDDILLRVIE